jgi:hypothetical protein
MVSRKSLTDKKKDKPVVDIPKGRKPDPKWNIDRLEDAVQDGVFTSKVGDELVIVRPRDGKLQKSICVVKAINDTIVETYDETRGQFYYFSLEGLDKYDVVVKKVIPKD